MLSSLIPSVVKCKRHMNGARRNIDTWTKEFVIATTVAADTEILRLKKAHGMC